MTLPYATKSTQTTLTRQESFGGLDLRLGAGQGAVCAMENMTGDHWPVLAARAPRRRLATLSQPQGMGAGEKLFWVDGGAFYYDGEAKGAVAEGDKRFCCLGSCVTIWPDKLFYNSATDEFGSLEAEATCAQGQMISCPAPSLISSSCNALYLPGCDLEEEFSVGEAVCVTLGGETVTPVIREIQGERMFFYDGSFALTETSLYEAEQPLAAGSYCFTDEGTCTTYSFELTEELEAGMRLILEPGTAKLHIVSALGNDYGTITAEMGSWPQAQELSVTAYDWPKTGEITVRREVPELEHLCQCANRLWGVYGDTICCSYLGNPKVWYNFDLTALACWSVQTGSPGEFTAACVYGGYPLFFKDDRIYRVYGTKSANYQLFETETLGVEPGSEKSVAVVGQTLYYKTRAGFVTYAGGVPRLIDTALGTARRENAVAGTDGRKYYVSCKSNEQWSVLVYDSQTGLWHREDDSQAVDMAWCGGELFMLSSDGEIWMLGRVRSQQGDEEETVESSCEFTPLLNGQDGFDAAMRLYFRVCAPQELTVQVQYDEGGVWEKVTSLTGSGRRVQTVQLVPRRCRQLQIRLCGSGEWKLWSLGVESEPGSRMGG